LAHRKDMEMEKTFAYETKGILTAGYL